MNGMSISDMNMLSVWLVAAICMLLSVARILDHLEAVKMISAAKKLKLVSDKDALEQNKENKVCLALYIELGVIAVLCQMINAHVVPKLSIVKEYVNYIWLGLMLVEVIIMLGLFIAGYKNYASISKMDAMLDKAYKNQELRYRVNKTVGNKTLVSRVASKAREDAKAREVAKARAASKSRELLRKSEHDRDFSYCAIKVRETPEWSEWILKNQPSGTGDIDSLKDIKGIVNN